MHKETDSRRSICFREVDDLPVSPAAFLARCQSIKHNGIPSAWISRASGKHAILFFDQPSTRTRLSFELAAKHLGMETSYIGAETSSMTKGETLADTLRYIAQLHPDVTIVRTSQNEIPFPPDTDRIWINAGSGIVAHPTQALGDYLTLTEAVPPTHPWRIGFCGDVSRSRVFRSHLALARFFSHVEVGFCSPNPVSRISHSSHASFRHFGSKAELIQFANIVYSDRNHKERPADPKFAGGTVSDHIAFYKLHTEDVPSETFLMSPGPIDFDSDMDRRLLTHPKSLIDMQVTHGLYVRIGLLALLLGIWDG